MNVFFHIDSSDEKVAYLTLIGDFKKNDTFFYFGISITVFLTLFIPDDDAFSLSCIIFPLFFPIDFLSFFVLLLLITALAIFVSLLDNL